MLLLLLFFFKRGGKRKNIVFFFFWKNYTFFKGLVLIFTSMVYLVELLQITRHAIENIQLRRRSRNPVKHREFSARDWAHSDLAGGVRNHDPIYGQVSGDNRRSRARYRDSRSVKLRLDVRSHAVQIAQLRARDCTNPNFAGDI